MRLRVIFQALYPSAVTSNPANGGHPKTGQRKRHSGQDLLYPARPDWSKCFQASAVGREPFGFVFRFIRGSSRRPCGNVEIASLAISKRGGKRRGTAVW